MSERRSTSLSSSAEPESLDGLRSRPELLVAFCFVGGTAAAASLPIAPDPGERTAIFVYFIAMLAIPVVMRLGLPLRAAKVAAMLTVLSFLTYVSQVPPELEFYRLYWLCVMPLASGLMLGGAGIVIIGSLSLVASAGVAYGYGGATLLADPRWMDSTIFITSVIALTFIYETQYARTLRGATRNLKAEAWSRQRLARSERELRAIFEQEPHCVKRVNRSGTVLDMNPSGLRMIGFDKVEEVRGLDIRELVAPEYHESFHQELETVFAGERTVQRFEIIDRRGQRKWMEQHAAPLLDEAGDVISMLAVTHDVTDRIRAEQEQLRSQRLDAIGSLAGGIAHDLNNVLTPLRLGLDEIRETSSEHEDVLAVMDAGVDHATAMLGQLLRFAQGAEGSKSNVEVQDVVTSVEKLLDSTFPATVTLVTKLEPALPTTRADPTQLRQVLLNLCLNARDALGDSGTITIEARAVDVERPEGPGSEGARPGAYVALSVEDDGVGIPPEDLPQIFEPFFTTKRPLKGTGLGLSAVLGIVTGHGGFLTVTSAPAAGTRITVYVPIRAGTEPREIVPVGSVTADLGRGRRALLVDDDESILKLAARLLAQAEFTVETAADGAAAAAQTRAHPGEVDVLVTDLHMPELDGLELIEQIWAERPELPVVLMSGRLDEAAQERLQGFPRVVVVKKPFGRLELMSALDRALHS